MFRYATVTTISFIYKSYIKIFATIEMWIALSQPSIVCKIRVGINTIESAYSFNFSLDILCVSCFFLSFFIQMFFFVFNLFIWSVLLWLVLLCRLFYVHIHIFCFFFLCVYSHAVYVFFAFCFNGSDISCTLF